MTMTRRSLVLAGAALAAAIPAAAIPATAFASETSTLSLPPPTGPFRVGTKALHLVDAARRDPLAPDDRAREFMVRLLYPTLSRRTPDAPYFSATLSALLVEQLNTAAGSTLPLDLLTFVTHARLGAAQLPGPHPLVLFSHGLNINAAFYTAILEDLASHGYVVAAVDHTFDALVEFPDGRVVPPAADVPFDLARTVRAADLRFTLDRLGCRSGVAAVGHSLGSMTVIEAIATDNRIGAGVILDGNPLGPASLDRPLLMLGAAPKHLRANDPDWAAFYDRLRGPRLHVGVNGMRHNDFGDLTLFKSQVDLASVFELGPIDGLRATTIVRAYARAWLDRSLRGRPSPLLVCEPARFPEIDFQP